MSKPKRIRKQPVTLSVPPRKYELVFSVMPFGYVVLGSVGSFTTFVSRRACADFFREAARIVEAAPIPTPVKTKGVE